MFTVEGKAHREKTRKKAFLKKNIFSPSIQNHQLIVHVRTKIFKETKIFLHLQTNLKRRTKVVQFFEYSHCAGVLYPVGTYELT